MSTEKELKKISKIRQSGTKIDNSSPVKISGGSILIFGDPHFSSSYTGTHRNYTLNCYRVMDKILEIAKNEKHLGGVIFLGDVIGVNERNLRDRQFLLRVYNFFQQLKSLSGGKTAMSVRGNHDYGDFPDFNFLEGLNVLENPRFVDYEVNDSLEVRFHLVNYGAEDRKLDLAGSTSDVVLGHNDYTIEGVTNWYGHKGNIEIVKQSNLLDVVMVISGHIHNPSPEIYSVTMPNGKELSLFYPGSPTRVSQRYDDCFYVKFEYNGTGTAFKAERFGLWPAEEEFYPQEELLEDVEGAEERLERTKKLEDILQEIVINKLTGGNLFEQVDRIPHSTPEARELAKGYLEAAFK